MDKTSLGDRMKSYEACTKSYLIRRMPVIVRIDGKAFHSLTKRLDKPYDHDFASTMMSTATYLVNNIMNCKFAYVQSDEINLLLVDYNTLETQAWFNNNIQKIASVSASMATAKFNSLLETVMDKDKRSKIHQSFAMFDARVFNIPKEDVANYFIWRQNDAVRNSIQGLGQAHFSQKQLSGKNNNEVQDMLMLQKSINWNNVEVYFKRGGCVYNNPQLVVDYIIPIFTQDRQYIEYHLNQIIEG